MERKRPDGATLVPWAHGELLAMVPLTDTHSHVGETAENPGATATNAAVNKTIKTTLALPHLTTSYR